MRVPTPPREPIKPDKNRKVCLEARYGIDCGNDVIRYLAEWNVELKDIEFEASQLDSYSDRYSVRMYVYKIITNEQYDADLKKYESDMLEYNKAYAQFKIDVATYNTWLNKQ